MDLTTEQLALIQAAYHARWASGDFESEEIGLFGNGVYEFLSDYALKRFLKANHESPWPGGGRALALLTLREFFELRLPGSPADAIGFLARLDLGMPAMLAAIVDAKASETEAASTLVKLFDHEEAPEVAEGILDDAMWAETVSRHGDRTLMSYLGHQLH